MGDKAFEFKLDRRLRTDIFGQAHTARKGAVNEYSHCLGIGIGNVEELFHQDSKRPHEEGGNEEGHERVHGRKGREQFPSLPSGQERPAQGQGQRDHIGIRYLEQVHEAGITQHARIRTEDACAYPAEYGKKAGSVAHGHMMLIGDLRFIGDPVDEYGGSKDDGGIAQQNNPIGQHLAAEIPV